MKRRANLWAAVSGMTFFLASATNQARELTFEDRVKAQEAIERVYYKHQIGAKVPFEKAIPAAVIEQKVRTVMHESAALKSLWHTSITTDALEREIERMNKGTRMPARLREIHAALSNDPLLIRECLARPSLVDRLVRNFFAYDSRIHGRAWAEAEDLHRRLDEGSLDPRDQEPHRILMDVVRETSSDDSLAANRQLAGPEASLNLPGRDFEVWNARVPRETGRCGPVLEEKDGFQIMVPLLREDGHVRAARYWVPKINWEDWWPSVEQVLPGDVSVLGGSSSSLLPGTGETAVEHSNSVDIVGLRTGPMHLPKEPLLGANAPFDADGCPVDDVWENRSLDDMPDGRGQPQSVWTGSLLVIWGGVASGGYFVTGGRYDPATDTWSPTTTLGAPSPRYGSVSVWTGSRMIVWGGGVSGTSYNNGALYDPVADQWTPTSTQNAPSRRTYAVAVWTGTEMVVWGGGESSSTNTGGRYNPVTDTWVPTSTANAPPPSGQATTVWTGTQMIVWGGGNTSTINTGGRYDPAADQWSSVTTVNAPSPRRWHSAIWTGSKMVVWGGDNIIPLGTGGRYDPVADVWTPTSNVGAPSLREHHSAVWTGSRMIVWGGVSVPNGIDVNTGAEYDPVADNWTPTSTVNAPQGRDQHAAVWTGSLMIVWGGYFTFGGINTGGRYDPTTSTWTPTSTGNNPGAVYQHTAVWTGTLMIEWGGIGDAGTAVNRGARYDPALDTWSPVPAYLACAQHVSVWTGDRMIVWGGRADVDSDLGGLYDPAANSWSAVSTANHPSPRHGHKAVWTGSQMIVWGGADANNLLNTGGVYDVATNTWTATSLTSAPVARILHTAVWTGNRMIIWGGTVSSPTASGGLYDPAMDTWTATSTMNAPSARYNHTAAWTGALMVVWGGFEAGRNGEPGTGGRYDPVSNTWTTTSALNAAILSLQPSSVWTGTNMLVWSARDGSGRYNPVTDTWRPLSSVDAPSNRSEHTAVWTGAQMILWGGLNGITLSSGGAYNADPDDDGDGYTVCAGDCNDNVSSAHPGATEVCDGMDNDCNVEIDEGMPPGIACDTGHIGICAAGTTNCTSGSFVCVPNVPTSPEVCDDLDNDCNDLVDDVAGGCTLFITDPLNADILDCRVGAAPPVISWHPAQYDRYKVFVSSDPRFPRTKKITSGKKLLTDTSYVFSTAKWAAICKKADTVLYIKVQGTDGDVAKSDPLRKFFGPTVVATAQK